MSLEVLPWIGASHVPRPIVEKTLVHGRFLAAAALVVEFQLDTRYGI
jgi:hypothetical protein